MSPQNTTYNTNFIQLNYLVNEPTAWVGYSLDGADNITLHGNTTLYLTDGEYCLTVYANDTAGNINSSTVCFTVYANVTSYALSLKKGWNMISLPVTPETTNADSIFSQVPMGYYALFSWDPLNKTYTEPSTVEPEKGYWILVLDECEVNISGASLINYTANLTKGWNMIGSLAVPTYLHNPDDIPDGSVLNNSIYTWSPANQSYISTTKIDPGKGYWILALQNCSLNITPTAPPPPPG